MTVRSKRNRANVNEASAGEPVSEVRTPAPIVRVPFEGEEILALLIQGQVWIVLRAMCERFGVSMEGQLAKAKSTPWICLKEIFTQMPGDDQGREVTCISLRSLAGWLLTIKAGKVKPEFREPLLRFQIEAADALYRHFFEKRQASHGDGVDLTALVNEVAVMKKQLAALTAAKGEMDRGVIGSRRAAVLVHGPLRHYAETMAPLLGQPVASVRLEADLFIRRAVDFPPAPGWAWEMLPEGKLGGVTAQLASLNKKAAKAVKKAGVGQAASQAQRQGKLRLVDPKPTRPKTIKKGEKAGAA